MHTCTVYRVRVWLGVWKESLNCDGPQFHKTNNHLSPHLKHKNPQHITLEIHVLSWERHKNVEGLNLIMGLQSTLSSWSLDNWISNISICIFTNDKKNLHRFTSTQKDHKKSLYNQPKPYFFKKLLWCHFWIDFNNSELSIFCLFIYSLCLYEWFLFVHNLK